MDCGDEDLLVEGNMELFEGMGKGGIGCEFRVREGGEDWEYWDCGLYLCVGFV